MREALTLAQQGLYTAHPNPRVGCVLVKNDQIIGRGFHQKAGQDHAEVVALKSAQTSVVGATCYVTLEPCAHFGKTPPCIDALIAAGIQTLVVAAADPNPQVAGKGIALAKAAGMTVIMGVCEQEAQALNAGFFKRQLKKMPLVRAKMAMSLDGRTALADGRSQWLTGSLARQRVQQWRARSGAILTGIGTVLTDNPQLLVRDAELLANHPCFEQPLRVLCDSQGRLPAQSQLASDAYSLWHVIAEEKVAKELPAGKVTKIFGAEQGNIDLQRVLTDLAVHQVNEVLIEAGPTLLGAFLEQQLVDELILHVSPKLLGPQARPLAMLPEVSDLMLAQCFELKEVMQLGQDVELYYQR
jgi:diaminohydroxyphosphoribosylaminopyrimidine deaminase/5-amino-6-(5-phosphoribosylamino)uracil reductase